MEAGWQSAISDRIIANPVCGPVLEESRQELILMELLAQVDGVPSAQVIIFLACIEIQQVFILYIFRMLHHLGRIQLLHLVEEGLQIWKLLPPLTLLLGFKQAISGLGHIPLKQQH